MRLADAITLSDFRTTDEGFLVAKARLARTGIQEYRSAELPGKFPALAPDAVVRVYRPEEEVFRPSSLDSLAGKPITIEHPDAAVTPDNAKDLVVGHVGDTIGRDGEFVTATVRLTHRDGILAANAGKVELSVGYDTDVEVVSGVTPDGQPFDAIQTNIRANHVALVDRGRCGSACRLHDTHDGPASEPPKESERMSRTIDCNGIPVEMTDQAARAFEALRDAQKATIEARDSELEELRDKVKDLEEQLAKSQARADDAEEKLKGANDSLKPEALDAAVKARASLLDRARKLAPELDATSLGDAQIKRAALEAIKLDLTDKSDAYIDAAFDARVELADSKPRSQSQDVAKQLFDTGRTDDAEANPRMAYMQRVADAYKREGRA